MAIDVTTEHLIRLADVPRLKWLPLRRGGKRLHMATVFRWVQDGLHGHRLEAVRCGGALATTEAALMRFFEALNGTQAPSNVRTSAHRERDVKRAERELAMAGI